jgi:tripartite-type tricarboxylate transporter receptor subunit TctC
MLKRLFLAITAAALAAASVGTLAQGYPTRPVRFLVGYAPGGPVDSTARILAQALQKELGQPIVVENRPGASGAIAADLVAKSTPDGHTIYFAASPTLTITPHVQKSMPVDVLRELAPIVNIVDYTNVLLINKDFPARSVAELVAYAKANPGKVAFGSAGMGASNHLSGELLKRSTGTDMVHVPYKGNAPAMADVVGGKIVFMFDITGTAKGFVDSGRARALAVTSRERNRSLPDVPTMIEAGVPGFEVTGWYALIGPVGLPREVVARLNAAVRAALADPALAKQLADLGYDVKPSSPDELAARIKREYELWREVSKDIRFE